MSAPKRKREVQLNFRVSPEELALIEQKMAQLGTTNREAYLRGAEGAGVPDALFQQQLEPAGPPCA